MSIIYYIDIICILYDMPHKADPTVICQFGPIISKYCMENIFVLLNMLVK